MLSYGGVEGFEAFDFVSGGGFGGGFGGWEVEVEVEVCEVFVSGCSYYCVEGY